MRCKYAPTREKYSMESKAKILLEENSDNSNAKSTLKGICKNINGKFQHIFWMNFNTN